MTSQDRPGAPEEVAVVDPVADPPRETGTPLDAWFARVTATERGRALWRWGAPLAVVLLAAVLRLVGLGNPHSLVFDETFYVKDAYSLLGNGYESTWPEDADESFNAGDTDIYSTDPSYVVHPPLGKWLIGLGIAAFGADDSTGWRIAVALAGIVLVALTVLIGRGLTGSTLVGVLAGGLLAIDGNAIVMSRVALLDGILAVFALAGVGAVLLDRRDYAGRLAARLVDPGSRAGWGGVVLARPWLVAAGVMFGCASAVKWSGLYFLAAFGLYVVLTDLLLRRRLGVVGWAPGALLAQGPVSFLLLVPVAVVVYLLSWTGWIVTSGGYDRQWVETQGEAWTGALGWVPLWFQNLWHYHVSAYGYHVGLSTPHPYQSSPLSWLLMIRPTNMYYEGSTAGQAGCSSADCASQITGLGNPLIWWAATAALLYLVYRLARHREWRVGFVLMGMVAGYLPWLLYLNRTVFQFYSIAFQPYMVLALAMVLGMVLGRPTDERWRRTRGFGLVGVFGGFVVLLTVFFWPLWTAQTIPLWYWQLHIWLPTWR